MHSSNFKLWYHRVPRFQMRVRRRDSVGVTSHESQGLLRVSDVDSPAQRMHWHSVTRDSQWLGVSQWQALALEQWNISLIASGSCQGIPWDYTRRRRSILKMFTIRYNPSELWWWMPWPWLSGSITPGSHRLGTIVTWNPRVSKSQLVAAWPFLGAWRATGSALFKSLKWICWKLPMAPFFF
jgi:hypothetical protein